jgi:histidine phosphotransferase ChpT
LSDDGSGVADDALDLVSRSAGQAVSLLQFYRQAYGAAGNRQGGDLRPLHELAESFFAHHKSELDWPAEPMTQELPERSGKLILNMLVLAAECLPRGGTVSVSWSPGEQGWDLVVAAAGVQTGLRDDAKVGLDPESSIESLGARSVHAYFTRLLARRLGGDLEVASAGPERLEFSAKVPA